MTEKHDYMQIALEDAFEKLKKTSKLNNEDADRFREYFNSKLKDNALPCHSLEFIQRCTILNQKYGLSVNAFLQIVEMDSRGIILNNAQKLLESGILIFNAKHI